MSTIFIDIEDEYRKTYETETVEKVIMPGGVMLNSWDEAFRVSGTRGLGPGTHKVPRKYKTIKIPYNQLYASFEDFMKEWCGIGSRDSAMKRYGYWDEPKTAIAL